MDTNNLKSLCHSIMAPPTFITSSSNTEEEHKLEEGPGAKEAC